MSAALVSLLAVGSGLSTVLRPGSKAVVVPARGGFGVMPGKGSVLGAVVPGQMVGPTGFQ